MGKAEGQNTNWHGHVTAVTVAPEFRRLGLAKKLMDYLENVSVELYDGYFVDLFVRVSNSLAIGMYEKFGYSVYRRVLGYYSSADDGEDAFGTGTVGAWGRVATSLTVDLDACPVQICGRHCLETSTRSRSFHCRIRSHQTSCSRGGLRTQ
jgi:hypothetical protein